jgi:hypothetical protein
MRPERLYRRGDQTYFRVNKAYNVKPDIEFIEEGYELITKNQSEITKTGLLTIFSLIPKNNGNPSFVGRWDQLQEVIDVDILNVEEQHVRAFRSAKHGFRGHRPQRISQDPRTFLVDISLPSGAVFKGTFTLNIGWGVQMPETLQVMDFVETAPGKGGFLSRMVGLFRNRK